MYVCQYCESRPREATQHRRSRPLHELLPSYCQVDDTHHSTKPGARRDTNVIPVDVFPFRRVCDAQNKLLSKVKFFSSSVLGNHDVNNISKIIIYMTRQLIFEQLIYQLLHFRFETNRGPGKQTDTTVIMRRLDFVTVDCILEEITRHGSWRLRSQRSHEEVVQYHSKVHDVRSEALRISRSSRMSENIQVT